MLLHHVVVVEQPLARRPDVRSRRRRAHQPRVRVGQHLPGDVEPAEQPRLARSLRERADDLRASQAPRALGEAVGAEQLALDRTREEVLRGLGTREERAAAFEQCVHPGAVKGGRSEVAQAE